MAVEEINSIGGINGRKIEVIYEDGKCNGKDAVTAAQKLINIDKVKIILGGACSGETLAVAPLAEQNKVILFSAFSTSPDITNAGDFVFRNAPSDAQNGKDSAELIFNDRHRNVAVLTENTDYGQSVRKVFKQRFEELGGKIVADEVYSPDSKDYRVQLTKIKAAKPDAVFFIPQNGISGGLAVKQAKELGINVPYYGIVVFSSGDALKAGGKALEGLVFTDTPGLSSENPKAVSFLEKFKSKYPAPASDYEIGARYDSVYIIANALKKCGEDTECIKNYLYNMDWYNGVIGRYKFDQNGDVVGIKYVIKEIKNGKVVERK
jgi:branched-chain amino acid transport system substrate-binding protein